MSDVSPASSAGVTGGGVTVGSRSASRHVRRVAARGQWLVDTPRPADGHDLRWHVEAIYVGDLTALAAAALQKQRRA
jgi:hypothetical protein